MSGSKDLIAQILHGAKAITDAAPPDKEQRLADELPDIGDRRKRAEDWHKQKQLQPLIAGLMVSSAQDVANLLGERGITPKEPKGSRPFWPLALKTIVATYPSFRPDNDGKGGASMINEQGRWVHGVALVGEGKLRVIKDGHLSETQTVKDHMLAPSSHIDPDVLPENQTMVIRWNEQLKSLGIHALSGTMSAYYPLIRNTNLGQVQDPLRNLTPELEAIF